MTATEIEHVLNAAREQQVDLVHLQFMDIEGTIKAVTIPAARLESSFEHGTWFDGSAVYGSARVVESDYCLRPEAATFVVLPWETIRTARLICGVFGVDGAPLLADPRRALKEAVAVASDMGFDYRVACELEFFFFKDTDQGLEPVDRSSYFEISTSRAQRLCYEAVDVLRGVGVEASTTHHEVGPSQYELDIPEMDALALADAIVSLKWILRVLARRDGLRVSFMPKPLAKTPGSGLHLHQALYGRGGAPNAFADPGAPYELSETGRTFVAGQLAHARGMCAILAPIVNSYKRLSGEDEAPSRVCWARNNRAALIRVPEATAHATTRVELRAPDPSCNPYLALAVALRAGLDGVANGLALPDPVEHAGRDAGSVEEQVADRLPSDLGEALEELDWDPVVRDALGHHIYEQLLAAKELEWAEFRRHISAWELDRYLDRA